MNHALARASASECVEKIQAYVDAGCTKFVLFAVAPPEGLVAQTEIYGRSIIPKFENRSAATK